MSDDPLTLSEQLLSGELPPEHRPPVSIGVTTTLTELGDGLGFVESFSNVAALVDDGRLVLVDAGGPLHAGAIHAAVRGWTSAPLDTVVFTHGHVDHVAGVGLFEAESGASPTRVLAHQNLPRRFDRYRLTNGWT